LYTELLEKKVKKATVKVSVSEAENLQLKNDFGSLAADKPFFPFGTQPMERSAFYIDYPEMFGKKWDTVSLHATWLNTPSDFKQHYIAYRKYDNNFNLSPNLYYQTLYFNYNSISKKYIKPAGLTYNLTSTPNN